MAFIFHKPLWSLFARAPDWSHSWTNSENYEPQEMLFQYFLIWALASSLSKRSCLELDSMNAFPFLKNVALAFSPARSEFLK